MFYTVFISASQMHIEWLQRTLRDVLKVNGHITSGGKHIIYQLKYAKRESRIIIKKLYPNQQIICLARKRLKIQKALGIIN